MFGFLNINKPAGPTSHDMVSSVRRLLGRKTKVGHAGTLDPFADGVLIVCVGPATRLADYVQRQKKTYVAGIVLGVTSTTDDSEGEITATQDAQPPSHQQIETTIQQFVGSIQQVPPAHSAVHVNGERAYKLARQGKEVQLEAREVQVYQIKLLSYSWPALEIEITCGSGTYIRSLARDIGQTLGVGGYCDRLTRTAIGQFTLDNAVAPKDLNPDQHVLPASLAVTDMPSVTVTQADLAELVLGRCIPTADEAALKAQEVALLDEDDVLAALAKPAKDGQSLQPTKVFCKPKQ